jgi:hypothetical protein
LDNQHYVDNVAFLKAILEYRKEFKKNKNKAEPLRVPEFIGECFMKIADGVSRRPNFANYTYREEMVGDAIENCLKAVRKFNPRKSKNPFSYFTQIIWYAFLRKIEQEENLHYAKCMAYSETVDAIELQIPGSTSISPDYHQSMLEFIDEYREKKERKKKRAQEKERNKK